MPIIALLESVYKHKQKPGDYSLVYLIAFYEKNISHSSHYLENRNGTV